MINININNITHYEGNMKFSNNQYFYIDFYGYHTLSCKPPEKIIDVYMKSSSILEKNS
jgi:hypothetical protein